MSVLIMDRREVLSRIDEDDRRWFDVAMQEWFVLDPPSKPFYTFWPKPALALARHVATRAVRLDTMCEVQRGITPFFPKLATESRTRWPALDGDLRRYTYAFSGSMVVEYHKDIAEYKDPRFFSGPRGIVRQLISRQFRLQAVATEERFVVNQSHQILLPKDEISADYLVGVVNSLLLSYLHVNKSALALRDDFPKLVLEDTRSLPIPRARFRIDAKRPKLLRPETPATVPAVLAELREIPEAVVARIIAESVSTMMSLDSQLHELVGKFHRAICRRALRQDVDDPEQAFAELKGKTALLDFHGDWRRNEGVVPFDEIVDVLRRNQTVSRDRASAGRAFAALHEDYDAAVGAIAEIKNTLSVTDRYIDLAVCRLFELDDEDVNLVESHRRAGIVAELSLEDHPPPGG